MLALIAASVGACSDPTPAAKVPPRSAVPATTAAATSPTVSPSPAKLTPEQEVEAAVRTYYAELTRAAQTNDTSKLKKLVHKNCPCYNAVKIIERNKREGERTPQARFILKSVRIHSIIAMSAGADVRYRVSAYDVVDSAGKVKEHIRAEKSHLDLSLVKLRGQWTVTNLFDLEGP